MTGVRRSILLLGFLVLMLSPYLITGWYQDDSLNASTRGILATRGYGVLDLWWQQNSEWITQNGRFFPFALLLQDLAFTYLPLSLSRLHQIGMVLIDLWLLSRLVRELGEGRPGWDPRLTWLPAVFAVLLFQLVEGHDSVASYNGLLQWTFFWGALHVWGIARFVRGRGSRWILLGAALAAFLALITYEVGIAFPVAAGLLLILDARKAAPAFRRLLPAFVAVATPIAVYLAITLVLRSRMTASYAGIQPKLGWAVARTFIYQWSGAVPLAHPLFGRCKVLRPPTLNEVLLALLAGAYAWGIFRYFANRATGGSGVARRPWPILIVGFCASLIPPAIIGLSARYQLEVNRPGAFYLPVYLTWVGTALLYSVAWVRRPATGRLAPIAVGIWAALAFGTNLISARVLNRSAKDLREQFLSAFQLPEVRARLRSAPIWLMASDQDAGWMTGFFIRQQAGRSVPIRSPLRASGVPAESPLVRFGSWDADSGWMLICPEGHARQNQWHYGGRCLLLAQSDPSEAVRLRRGCEADAARELRPASWQPVPSDPAWREAELDLPIAPYDCVRLVRAGERG
jgi:hypothetical protein